MTEAFGNQLQLGAAAQPAQEGGKPMSADSFCGWPVAAGVWWIQTREPRLARKLSRRSDTRLVSVGVAGGFLRIFEMQRSPSFVRRLTARYKAANERFRELEAHDNARNGTDEWVTAGCHL